MDALAKGAQQENRGLTVEELAKFDEIEGKVDGLKRSIKAAERLDQLNEERGLATTQPVSITVTRNEGEDENGRCVVWRSLGDQLMAVAQIGKHPHTSGEVARKLDLSNKILRAAASGMSESVMADGGYLVQTDYSTKLLERSYQTGKLVSRVQEYPLSGGANAVNLPMVDETSRANGSRNGGIRVYWEDEADAYTASKPKFSFAQLKLKKVIGLVYTTDELLEDAGLLQAWVERKFPEEFGFALDEAILNGEGAGKPRGIFKSNALVVVAKESGQAAATINAMNLAKMLARFHEDSLGNALWVYNQGMKAQLMTLSLTVGSNTIPVFIPGGQSGTFINSIPVSTILGIPAIAMEQCEALGTQGDIGLIDPSKYLMIKKGDIKASSSLHVRFLYDEQVFKFSARKDGQPEWKAPLTPYKGSDTIGPFVVLQTRS
jgi:HK97 family phage major capsid protein